MISLFKHRWNRIAVRIALGSFIIGTLLMLTALMAENDIVMSIGVTFLVFYIPLTCVLLFVLTINLLAHLKDIHEHVIAFICVLLNLPIAVLYVHFINF